MVRKLKYHEKKLLRKVDFLEWKNEHNVREIEVMRRYQLEKREEYIKYNKVVGQIQHIGHKLKLLDSKDEIRIQKETELLEKLYNLGFISTKSTFSQIEKISVSSICRRRLPVLMCKLKMVENVPEAVKFIRQGHVRVGPQVVTDPAFLVTRSMEDFVTWVDNSKIKVKILKYNDKLDDYDLIN